MFLFEFAVDETVDFIEYRVAVTQVANTEPRMLAPKATAYTAKYPAENPSPPVSTAPPERSTMRRWR